jgi:hypothetical protein
LIDAHRIFDVGNLDDIEPTGALVGGGLIGGAQLGSSPRSIGT